MNPDLGEVMVSLALYSVLAHRALINEACSGTRYLAQLAAQREDGVPPLRTFCRLVPDEDGVFRLVLS